MRTCYWQVQIAKGDEHKTTCMTRYGSYDFLVMLLSLTNAPATFCTLMNQVFQEYIDEFVVVYLDDIVVNSQTLEEHLEHLRKVLAQLWEHELYAKLSKCSFAQKQIDFLGYVIKECGIKIDQQKIQAITYWSPPKDIHTLRSFLGLCNLYRPFMKNHFLIGVPLIELLKMATPWDWGPRRAEAFNALKKAMSSSPVMALPDLAKPFKVQTDAFDYALAGVLLQDGHPVP
ncbi:uncharacterized mitochondrial protein AtMg00860-like [Nicotiana tomentosiformis]|uniref:uncharacterized mitochondrial protein AtMg00860-like n=1 Tax=Nicotiana tomentosiformis TaxID=4098 RepID=UPI0008782205|nr:uncharacterized mitochondrial protein AtMg00860-like [Nicotiana tomentosiformis]